MIVTLMPGDVLLVNLHETDGAFTISYDADGNQKLTVHADMPDTEGREGIIYCEDFSQTPEEKLEVAKPE